jgi:membrane fusion protein (multidrug efflux system)
MSARSVGKTPPQMKIPLSIGLGVLGIGIVMGAFFLRARSEINKVALSEQPKGVTTIEAQAARYRPSRRYVGTVAPWLEARIGPQFTAAYVDTVLVRPGDRAKKGQILATLDCKSASAQSQAQKMQARALSATQEAIANEAGRLSGLLKGGYVSPNEVERRTAESASKQAELLAANARMVRASLEVDDCILRAPFDGEVADRMLDPGGFARPGSPILTIVDREKVRILVDVPEGDFAVVAERTPVRVRLVALVSEVTGVIARRAPAADSGTRTVHAEIDLADAQGKIPVGTTAELTIEIGEPLPATELPLRAASVRGESATVFVVKDGSARKLKIEVMGESGGSLFVAPTLSAGTRVVSEGRALLKDGDRVTDKLEAFTATRPQTSPPPAPGKEPQP